MEYVAALAGASELASNIFRARQNDGSALRRACDLERLSIYHEHEKWLSGAQGATLAADWLARSNRSIKAEMRRHWSELSDQLARQIAETLSREAGFHIAPEMMESLDPHYVSDIG